MASKISVSKTPAHKSKSLISKRNIIIALAAIILVILLYFINKQLVVATVNGEPIYRLTLISELEKQGGKQVVQGLITKMLIFQEAKKKNINISEADIDTEIKRIEQNLKNSGQSLDQVLKLQGMSMAALRENTRLNLIVRKLVGDSVKVSDKEVDDYIKKTESTSSNESGSVKPSKTEVRQQLEQRKNQEKVQELIKSLQDKAKISYNINF